MNGSIIGGVPFTDTIAALATPPGTAGIAVIRVSGPEAIEEVAGVFSRPDVLRSAPTHTLHHGAVLDRAGEQIDEVVASVFRAPHSYTGEDSVEISCHGGTVVSRTVLERLLEGESRLAQPGEFTRRAFLNGKIDLVQAEAVADVIHAQSEHARRASVQQLRGTLSAFVGPIREKLLHAVSMLELGLDFVEEDVEFLERDEIRVLISDTAEALSAALETFENGRLIRDGIRVALIGAPNVGKSSLLNALLGVERAIVTEIPGTTRDFIEEARLIGGVLFRFIDTAGLRESTDIVERRGMEITRAQQERADFVLRVLDARDGMLPADSVFEVADALDVYNKADLLDREQRDAMRDAGGMLVSAKEGEGLDALTLNILERARRHLGETEQATVLVTNARHAQCLRDGLEGMRAARAAADEGLSEEFIAAELRRAADKLGELIGAVTTDEVLDGIFSRFCIGK
jgi:tRNA modification GTPase